MKRKIVITGLVGNVELTKAETETLKLVADGLKSEEIAESRFVSLGYVNNTLTSIYSKLGIVSGNKRAQAVSLYEKYIETIKSIEQRDSGQAQGAFDIRSLSEFLEDIDRELEKNQQAIDVGIPQQVSSWLEENILPKLYQKTYQTMYHASDIAWPLQECLTRGLYQHGESLTYWKTHSEAAANLANIAEKLDRIANISGQLLPKMLALRLRSSMFHLLENHIDSEKHASDAIEIAQSTTSDPNMNLELLTLKATALANLGAEGDARKTANQIQDIIESSSNLNPVSLRGGLLTIAGVEYKLGSAKFWEKLAKAKAAVANRQGGYMDHYNGLRLIYTELKGMKSLGELDIGHTHELTKTAALISAQHTRLYLEVQNTAEAIFTLRKSKK